jgi:predicted lipoprotein
MNKSLVILIVATIILSLAGCQTVRTTTTTFPTITIGFAGDVMLERRILPFLEEGMDPFEEVAPVLRKFTIAFVNLETSVSTQGNVIRGKPYVFMSAPRTLALVTNGRYRRRQHRQ